MMRILLMLIAVLSFAIMTNPANAEVKLTHEQVDAVCGGNSKPNASGHTGCVKDCGDKVCLYDCKGKGKTEDCRGYSALVGGGGGTDSGDQPEAYLPLTPGVTLVMDFVNYGELRFGCSQIDGSIFGKTDNKSVCVNPDCDKAGGACAVFCIDRTCHAVMPGKPPGKLTLLGILQNGDNISHVTTPSEPNATKDGGAALPSTGSPSPPPPPPVG